MKKLLAIFIMCIVIIGCNLTEPDFNAGDYYSELTAKSDSIFCYNKDINNVVLNNYIDTTLGIYLGNGLYITGVYRGFNIAGVDARIEFYNANFDTTQLEYEFNGRWNPYDTMFSVETTLKLTIPRGYHKDLLINLTTGDWQYKLYTVSLYKNGTPSCLDYGISSAPQRRIIWSGNMIIGRNNDYIRRTCTDSHACSGKTTNDLFGTACSDGWISYSSGSGTCSHHGGITK